LQRLLEHAIILATPQLLDRIMRRNLDARQFTLYGFRVDKLERKSTTLHNLRDVTRLLHAFWEIFAFIPFNPHPTRIDYENT
jgi:hypothetical protein